MRVLLVIIIVVVVIIAYGIFNNNNESLVKGSPLRKKITQNTKAEEGEIKKKRNQWSFEKKINQVWIVDGARSWKM